MTDLSQALNVKVSLADCAEEGECVEIRVAGEPPLELRLSPPQARALASDLIQAVYRAEVKQSLRAGRGSNASGPRQAGAGLLGTEHLAPRFS